MRYVAPAIAFLVSISFLPGIAGAATSPRWAVAAVSLWFLDWYTIPFVALCFAALEFDQAVHWAIVSAAFCWGLKYKYDVKWSIILFALGIGASGIVAICQRAGFEGIPQLVIPGGLFLNKNVMGEAAALAFIVAVGARLWPGALICLPALVLSTSRAAWIGAFVGLFLFLSWRWRIVLLLIGFAIVAFFFVNGYNLSLESLIQRWSIWHDAVINLHWFGNGSYDYSTVQNREPNLHNDWLQFIYELGIFGIIPIATVLVAGTHNRGSAAFCATLIVVGSFGFPLHNPASAWFAAFVIGHYMGLMLDERRSFICLRNDSQKLSGVRYS